MFNDFKKTYDRRFAVKAHIFFSDVKNIHLLIIHICLCYTRRLEVQILS